MPEERAPPEAVLAQAAGEDRKPDAGLRGEELGNAVAALALVFGLGLAVLGVVVWSGRRRTRRDGDQGARP